VNPADLLVGMTLQMPPDDDVEMPAPEEVTNSVSASSQDVVMGPPPLPPLTEDADLMIASDLRLPPSSTSTDEPSGKASASATEKPARAKPSAKPAKPAGNPATKPAAKAKQGPAALLPPATASAPVTSARAESASAPPADEGLDADGKLVNKMVVPTMWGLEGLNYAMRNELLEMSVEEREQRIKALRRMSDFDRMREMNLAFNRVVLVHLGLNQVAGFLGMKRTKTGKGRARKKQKKTGEDDEEEWGTSKEESGSEAGEQNDSDNDNGVDRTPVKTRNGRAAVASGGGSKAAPKWAEMAKKGLLDAVALGMRTDWKELVGFWWGLEEQSSFASSISFCFALAKH
jgi:hypothetical protein